MGRKYSHGGYLQYVHTPGKRKARLARAVKDLTPHKGKFSTIVCTGISGMLIGIPLAQELNKHIMVLRKEGEQRHSGSDWEGTHPGEGYNIPGYQKWNALWVDDFVESGATEDRVILATDEVNGVLVGRYLYNRHTGSYPNSRLATEFEPYPNWWASVRDRQEYLADSEDYEEEGAWL